MAWNVTHMICSSQLGIRETLASNSDRELAVTELRMLAQPAIHDLTVWGYLLGQIGVRENE